MRERSARCRHTATGPPATSRAALRTRALRPPNGCQLPVTSSRVSEQRNRCQTNGCNCKQQREPEYETWRDRCCDRKEGRACAEANRNGKEGAGPLLRAVPYPSRHHEDSQRDAASRKATLTKPYETRPND